MTKVTILPLDRDGLLTWLRRPSRSKKLLLDSVSHLVLSDEQAVRCAFCGLTTRDWTDQLFGWPERAKVTVCRDCNYALGDRLNPRGAWHVPTARIIDVVERGAWLAIGVVV